MPNFSLSPKLKNILLFEGEAQGDGDGDGDGDTYYDLNNNNKNIKGKKTVRNNALYFCDPFGATIHTPSEIQWPYGLILEKFHSRARADNV